MLIALGVAVSAGATSGRGLTPIERLGEKIHFDEALSEPDGQACASCHLPEVGFDHPNGHSPVSEGVKAGRFGGRNAPISAHAMYAPALQFDEAEQLWLGGQFWDGLSAPAARSQATPWPIMPWPLS